MEYAQVLSKLFIGSHPRTEGDVQTLRRQLRISAVVNLQTDDDMVAAGVDWPPVEAHYSVVGIRLYRFPIKEEQSEMQEKFAAAIGTVDRLLASGETVYLHCTAGIARCPSVAIGYLHSQLDWEFDKAVAHVKNVRKCSPHLDALRVALLKVQKSEPSTEKMETVTAESDD